MNEVKVVTFDDKTYAESVKAVGQLLDDNFEIKGFSTTVSPITTKLVGSILLVKRHRGEMDVTWGGDKY